MAGSEFIDENKKISLSSAHTKQKIEVYGGGHEWIGTSGSTLELSGANINLNGGQGTGSPTLKYGGTTIMDTSRNMSNIGTISSGAITTSGNLTTSANAAVFAHGFTSGSRGFNFESGDESVGTIRFDANTMRFWSGGAGGGSEKIRINDDATDSGRTLFFDLYEQTINLSFYFRQ